MYAQTYRQHPFAHQKANEYIDSSKWNRGNASLLQLHIWVPPKENSEFVITLLCVCVCVCCKDGEGKGSMSSSSTVEHVFLSLQFLGLDLHHTLPLPSLMAHNLCMIAIVILAAIINGYVFLSRLWVRRGQKLPAVFPCVHHHGRHSLAAGEGVNKGTDAPVCCLYPPGTRSTALRYRRCCYGNQDIGSTWAWGPHKTPWRRAHGKQDLREVQESHRFQGTTAGLDGSWPVGGRGDAVDPISAPTLSLQGRLPDFRWPQHLRIFAWGLSPVTSSAHAPKTGVWGIDSQPSLSGWWELAQKFPSSLDPRWNKGGLCVPYGSSGSLAGLSSRVLPCPDPQEEPVSPLGQASHTLLEGQKKYLDTGTVAEESPVSQGDRHASRSLQMWLRGARTMAKSHPEDLDPQKVTGRIGG